MPDSVEERDGTDPNDALSFRDADANGVPDYLEQPPAGGDSSTVYLSFIMQGVMTPAAAGASTGDAASDGPTAHEQAAGSPEQTEAILSIQLYLPAIMN